MPDSGYLVHGPSRQPEVADSNDPGSVERIATLRQRAAADTHLWHNDDLKWDTIRPDEILRKLLNSVYATPGSELLRVEDLRAARHKPRIDEPYDEWSSLTELMEVQRG